MSSDDACVRCGDEYGEEALSDAGLCGGCLNEDDGLCWCGRAIYDGYRQCAECAAEDRADALFHANR